MNTIGDAKDYIKNNIRKGVVCPCCTQNVKEYKRKLNSAMALCLIECYKKYGKNTWFHIREMISDNQIFALNMNGGNFATLSYWGVIEEKPKNPANTTSRTSGIWRLTDIGEAFVRNQLKVAKYVYTYNMNMTGASTEEINIIEALGNKFNYEELMNS